MSCFHPYRAFYTGASNEKGRPVWYVDFSGRMDYITRADCEKRGIENNLSYASRITDYIELPCGKCPGCKKAHAYNWALRCQAEASLHKYNYFITLTYDDEHVPFHLYKKDLQDYHKRLRKLIGPFRFFACGEYGSQTHRPHYHEILFLDAPIHDLVLHTQNGNIMYFNSATFDKAWNQGFVLLAESNLSASIYVSSYLNKGKTFGDEFILMSRRPGLGGPLFDKAFSGEKSLVVNAGIGKSVNLHYPRYFKEKRAIGKSLAEVKSSCAQAKRMVQAQALASGYEPHQLDDFREVCDQLGRRPKVKKS